MRGYIICITICSYLITSAFSCYVNAFFYNGTPDPFASMFRIKNFYDINEILCLSNCNRDISSE